MKLGGTGEVRGSIVRAHKKIPQELVRIFVNERI